MSPIGRGIRNAFRNSIRTLAITTILGLSIGLSLAMLIAHQAVGQKIDSVKANVGNTVSISPAGFNPGSQANNALSSTSLQKVQSIPHVTQLAETLSDRLGTTGSSQPAFGGRSITSSNATTSLTSPIQININHSGNGQGPSVFISGGGGLPSNFSPPVSFLGTNDPSQINGSDITIKSGKTIDGSQDTNNVLVSNSMASKNNLKVGSTFQAYNTTLTVSGLFSGSTQSDNDTVVLSLPTEQRLSGQSDVITGAVATVDSLDNLSGATNAIKATLGSSADVVSAQDQANETVKPLQNIQTISLYSLIGAVVAGAIIILMVMIMVVRERRREIGVIKAIGGSNFKIMFQFMVEAITLTGLGAVVGIILGVIAGNPITHLLVTNSTSSPSSGFAGGGGRGFGGGGAAGGGLTIRAGGRGFGLLRNNVSNIHAIVGWSIILYGLAAAIIIALIGSALTSFFIAKIRPAEVMRVE